MNSHTVPQKLLKQFAFCDSRTKSMRLWCYQKGIPPYLVFPKKATAFEGYFSDPDNPAKENEIETRLNNEIENPVHTFLSEFNNPSFVLSDIQRRQMTRYLTMLFWRSEAQKNGRKQYLQVTQRAVRQFLSNESHLLTVTATWYIDRLFSGHPQSLLETRRDIIRTVSRLASIYQTERNRQKSYVGTIERWMDEFDDAMYEGQWQSLRTSKDNPFIISDAPVVTWERKEDGALTYGIGVHEPNVEVLLPVSPLTCLQILPKIARNRPIQQPTVREVNLAQAAFAHKHCFANIKSNQIDEIMQQEFGKAEIGVKAFTVRHIDGNALYETLMTDRPYSRREKH
jgi:hypothetical protein